MTREEYIKAAIKSSGYNLKEFAHTIHMPYTTLLSILNGSIGGAALDNVLKICRPLSISIEDLSASRKEEPESDGDELRLLIAALPPEKKAALLALLR